MGRTKLSVIGELLATTPAAHGGFHDALVETLLEPAVLRDLAHRLSRSRVRERVGFLVPHPVVARVLDEVGQTRWQTPELTREIVERPVLFPPLARRLLVVGYGSWANPIGCAIVDQEPGRSWESSRLRLAHLSHVLRVARESTPERRRGFVERLGGADWIERRIATDIASELPPSLWSIWHFAPEVEDLVIPDALAQRLAEVLGSPYPDVWWLRTSLKLVGACALYAVSLTACDVVALSSDAINKAVAGDGRQAGHLTPGQLQVWLGLHELARLRGHVAINDELTDELPQLVATTVPGTPRHENVLDVLSRFAQTAENGMLPAPDGRLGDIVRSAEAHVA